MCTLGEDDMPVPPCCMRHALHDLGLQLGTHTLYDAASGADQLASFVCGTALCKLLAGACL